jgi:hypothetical protein
MLIALRHRVFEVNGSDTTIWQYSAKDYIWCARRQRDGNTMLLVNRGGSDRDTSSWIDWLDPKGNLVKTEYLWNLDKETVPTWCNFSVLPSGNVLVTPHLSEGVSEFSFRTPEMKQVWVTNRRGDFSAARLPNGNTVVSNITEKSITEFDRAGKVVRTIKTKGRPWLVKYLQ